MDPGCSRPPGQSTSAPLVPGPVLIAGVSPPAAAPGRYRRRGQGTASPIQGSAGARDSVDELSFWGKGWCAWVMLRDRVPHPQSTIAGWAQAGWGNIREAFPVIGKERAFSGIGHLISAAAPSLDSLPWPLDTWGSWPRTAWQRSRGRNFLSVQRPNPGGLCSSSLGKHLVPHLKGGRWARTVLTGVSAALTHRPSGRPPDPCCHVSRTPGLSPVRQGLLQEGGLGLRWVPRPLVTALQSSRHD